MAKVTSGVETITPERALNLLSKAETYAAKHGFKQRSLKKGHVKNLAKAMTGGHWQLNGEAIIVDKHGVPKDGQHRLHACVQAQKPFETMVVYGVEPEVFRTIDTGATRTMGDILTIVGEKDVNVFASALSVLYKVEANKGRITAWSKSSDRPTKAMLLDLAEKHPKLQEYVARTSKLRRLMSAGLAATLWYLMAKRDTTLADMFWGKIGTGDELRRGDILHTLRERMIKERNQRPSPTQDQTADIIVRAWNALRRGETTAKLQRGKSNVEMDLAIR